MSTTPPKGKADYYAPGDWNALCFECGRKFKASEMRRHWQGYWVCAKHWEARHPQDFVRGVPDRQAPPWTQPPSGDSYPLVSFTVDTADYTVGLVDIGGLQGGGTIYIHVPGGFHATAIRLNQLDNLNYKVTIFNEGLIDQVFANDARLNTLTMAGQGTAKQYKLEQITLFLPDPVTVGQQFGWTLILLNMLGTPIKGYSGTFAFATGDPLGFVPGPYTFLPSENGQHAFFATLSTEGSQTIFATEQGTLFVGSESTTVEALRRLTINTASNVNVFDKALIQWPDAGSRVIAYEVTVNGTIDSTDPTVPALYWGVGWPVGIPSFKLVNTGTIKGKGGLGGDSGTLAAGPVPVAGSIGGDGGDALNLAGKAVTINNAAGNIWGGGGGGGGGGFAGCQIYFSAFIHGFYIFGPGGGGGFGAGGVLGDEGDGVAFGVQRPFSPPVTWTNIPGDLRGAMAQSSGPNYLVVDGVGSYDPGAGTGLYEQVMSLAADGNVQAGGAGATTKGYYFDSPGVPGPLNTATGGAGGNGGDYGQAGQDGGAGVVVNPNVSGEHSLGGTGGLAGNAIRLAGGVANFLSGNNPAQVKGAVS